LYVEIIRVFWAGDKLFSREHEPIHVHGRYQDREMKAEIYIEQGKIVKIIIKPISKKKPLQEPQLSDFEKVVHQHAQDIIRKWADYFFSVRRLNVRKLKGESNECEQVEHKDRL
jgi:hypothetical protein